MAVSCQKNKPEAEKVPEQTIALGAYILNNGNYASNDASISFYDYNTSSLVAGVFQSANGKKLGDLAQDMLIYGNKMYIGVYNSKVVFVTDKKGKIVKELKFSGESGNLSPREFTAHSGKVYVSLYEGYVAQIDTTDFSTKMVTVGDNPEGMAVSNEKLFVANSGGMNYPVYGKTVSVVDLKGGALDVIATLDVADNPTDFVVGPAGELFLISMGNYADVINTLQEINKSTYEVKKVTDTPITMMDMGPDGKLYFISAQYGYECLVGTYSPTSKSFDFNFITDGTTFVNTPMSISVDPVTADVYIGTSDYVTEGDMYVFSKDGKLKNKFGTGGLNPIGTYFLSNAN